MVGSTSEFAASQFAGAAVHLFVARTVPGDCTGQFKVSLFYFLFWGRGRTEPTNGPRVDTLKYRKKRPFKVFLGK